MSNANCVGPTFYRARNKKRKNKLTPIVKDPFLAPLVNWGDGGGYPSHRFFCILAMKRKIQDTWVVKSMWVQNRGSYEQDGGSVNLERLNC